MSETDGGVGPSIQRMLRYLTHRLLQGLVVLAAPELQRAVDRLWQQILAEDW